ncbi:acetyl-CoA C-acetyltransferase [Kineobactrum salinum]|uniref:acetyl-CoA C-acetyltransferase n=1 Tax=Kineobactrum salinum TaxID=2708301 RepID=UPI0018D95F52|nr:acetyl-CoA C-acetyltransferase [Kineobactrum salinum]
MRGPLLLRQPFLPTAFDEVILGCVNVLAGEMNPARVAALRLGLGPAMPAYTVQINCGSGMLSIDRGFRAIRDGSADLVLAGGSEALSHAPLYFGPQATDWLAALNGARSLTDKLKLLRRFRPSHFKPVIGLLQGLTDPVVELNMGQTAELLAHLFDISRAEADAYAAGSHHRLARAQQQGYLADEVTPAFSPDGRCHEFDNGVRPDTDSARLAALKPTFEKPWGQVTAGNSSQISDGASWVVLASGPAVERHALTPRARIVDSHWSALDPAIMGLGPVLSATRLLQRQALEMSDVDLWEINEAFAAQVLACLKAWNSAQFCREALGLEQPPGAPELDRLNVDGGAISLGHPVGTSGNRIVLHLANTLQRLDRRLGVATECIGGGQGGAMLLERSDP